MAKPKPADKEAARGAKAPEKPLKTSNRPKAEDSSSSSSSSSSDDEDDEFKVNVVERPGEKPLPAKSKSVKPAPQPAVDLGKKVMLPLSSDEESDDSSSSEDEGAEQIKVNAKYATEYQRRKEREDALKSVSLFDDEEEEEESSDDEIAEELTNEIDSKINQTIEMIRLKDPRIYQREYQPFGDNQGDDEAEDDAKVKSKKKSVKTYKDIVRERALAGKLNEDDSDDDDNDDKNASSAGIKTYTEEQEEAKQAFKRAVEEADDSDDEELKLEAKSKATPLPPASKLRIKPADADEAFLWKFINERTWLKDSTDMGTIVEKTAAELEEDEEDLDKMEEFEQRFNFRFEEPGAAEIVSHARHIEGSLRRKEDSARSRQRQAKAERKEKERQEKVAELRRLKDIRRKMIEEQLQKSFSQAGRGAKIPFNPEDLDKDFDPEEWDRKMAEAFNDDYYAEDDDELKVVDEEEGSFGEEGVGNGEDDDDEAREARAEAAAELVRKIARDQVETEFEDEDFVGEGKFRYREVPANNYGLTDDEILYATNQELNAFVSLKRMAPYVEKEWHASAKHRNRFRRALKKRLETDQQHQQPQAKKKPKIEGKQPSASKPPKASGELVAQMSSARLKSYGRA